MLFKAVLLALLTGGAVVVDAATLSTSSKSKLHCRTALASTSHSGKLHTSTVTRTHTSTSTVTKTATRSVPASPGRTTSLTTQYTTVVATVVGGSQDTTTTTSTLYTTVTGTSTQYELSDDEDYSTTTITNPYFDPVKSTLPTTAGQLQNRSPVKRHVDGLQRREPRASPATYPGSVQCTSYVTKTITTTKTVTATKTTGTAKRSTVVSTVTSTRHSTSTALPSHALTTITTDTTDTVTITPTVYRTRTVVSTETDFVTGPSPQPVCGEDNYVSTVGGLNIVSTYTQGFYINLVDDDPEYASRENCCNQCYLEYDCYGTIYGSLSGYNNVGDRCYFIGFAFDRLARKDVLRRDSFDQPPTYYATANVQQNNPDGSPATYEGGHNNFTISNGLHFVWNDVNVLSYDCCP